MSRSLPVLALALLSLAVAVPAHAVLYTVNFTVTGAANDNLHAGQTADGSFSFDSSIIPGTLPGSVNPGVVNLSFDWDGTSWTDANTTFYSLGGNLGLAFDANGTLVAWQLGGDPNSPTGLMSPGPDDIRLYSANNDFSYVNDGNGGSYGGQLTWSVTTGGEAPEPGTLALFAPGLLALGLIRRRKS